MEGDCKEDEYQLPVAFGPYFDVCVPPGSGPDIENRKKMPFKDNAHLGFGGDAMANLQSTDAAAQTGDLMRAAGDGLLPRV